MTRPIEFRAWDKKQENYNEWHGVNDTENIELNELIDLYQKREFVLEQFTGLLDKNGTKIFEGDIVEKSYPESRPQRRSFVFAVEYKELFDNEMGFSLGIGFDLHGEDSQELEVIGNIHQNPELLESSL